MQQETNFYTYIHCKPDGTPFYVGKGSGRRAYDLAGRTAHHKNIVKKYGKGNIGVFTFLCVSEQEALDDEVLWIEQLRAEGFVLCNITAGGDGVSGMVHSAETRAKMSLAKMGNQNLLGHHHSSATRAKISLASKNSSQEARSKMSAALVGNTRMLGHRHTDEAKAKITSAQIGRKHSAATKLKMSLANERHSPESRRSAATKHTGMKRSDEARAKMSAAAKARCAANARPRDAKGTWHRVQNEK